MSIHDRQATKSAAKVARSPRGYAGDVTSPRCSSLPMQQPWGGGSRLVL